MQVNEELIDRLAHLARLEFDATAKKQIEQDLKNMIAFVEKLHSVPTEGVEPLLYITEERDMLREDVSVNTLTHEEVLRNAPLHDSDYIKVPKVLKK